MSLPLYQPAWTASPLEKKFHAIHRKVSKSTPAQEKYEYVRVGDCHPEKCGAFCCRIGAAIIPVEKNKHGRDKMKYYLATGMQKIGELDGQIVLAYNHVCQHLNRLRCGIYKTRPGICRKFPEDKGQYWYKLAVQNGCTYRFKKVKIK